MESLLATEGLAIFITGILGILLWAVYILRNWAAGVMWALSIIVLLFSGLFSIGIEAFWMSTIATSILLVVGMVARWVA